MLNFDTIQNNNKKKEKFLKDFKKTLELLEEVYLGEIQPDHVLNVFKKQGYWNGVNYRIAFDPVLGFEYEEK